ncbi:MAG: serine/threonine protein phosphatase [Rhodospirillales bacterium]|nr:serine/threonine protein phosphatase [Rhodospirillales bacterium]
MVNPLTLGLDWSRRLADGGAAGGPARGLARLFARRQRVGLDTARVPEGVRVYVIGDIHGCLNLLKRLHGQIIADARWAGGGLRNIIVYLGDYVDRGLHSREVVDLLAGPRLPGFDPVFLRGNHEQQFLDFFDNPASGGVWFKYGGDATVYSYGVRIAQDIPPAERFVHVRDRLAQLVPRSHIEFLARTQLYCEIGDYAFVHAGIRPEVPLERQVPEDLLWIRDGFLDYDRPLDKVVVHGHSVSDEPQLREHRIGIDTGACYGNALTCLVLEGGTRRILSVSDAGPRMARAG